MFDALVNSIAGADTWEWQNKARLNKIKKKYVKWILCLDKGTPNYTYIREGDEDKRTKIIEILRRAIKYEKMIR